MAILRPNRDLNNEIYLEEARKLHLPVKFFNELHCTQIKLGGQYYYIYGSIIPFIPGSDMALAANKYLMNQVLIQA